MISEGRGGKSSVTDVALVIAVGEPCCDFSQVALPDRLTAQRTERLRAGCPAIDQDEFHVSPPSLHSFKTTVPRRSHGLGRIYSARWKKLCTNCVRWLGVASIFRRRRGVIRQILAIGAHPRQVGPCCRSIRARMLRLRGAALCSVWIYGLINMGLALWLFCQPQGLRKAARRRARPNPDVALTRLRGSISLAVTCAS
jgi:hypothetical protein